MKGETVIEGRNRQTLIFIIVLTVGALFSMGTHFFPDSSAVYVTGPWIFLPCFLYVSRNMTTRLHYVLWSVFWGVSYLIRYWGWLKPLSFGISLALELVAAVVYSGAFWLDRYACRKHRGAESLWVFPFAFAAIDYVTELLKLGSLFSLSLTQFDNKPLLQLAAILGSKGITFVLALSASFIVYYHKKLKAVIICIAAILLLHLCGQLRINACAPLIKNGETLKVGWSAEPVTEDSFFGEGNNPSLEYNIESLGKALDEAEKKGAEILCFPEETFMLAKDDINEFVTKAQQMAADHKISVFVPIEAEDPDDEDAPYINECIFIDSDGEIRDEYFKTMLVPVVETPYYVTGDGSLPAIDLKIGQKEIKVSYAICFDGDFPSYIRTMPSDTDLFVDMSWDWDELDELHYRIIGMRAVENGVTVIKPTICGYTTVTDYLGRLVSKTHSDETGYQGVNLIELPLSKCDTIYHSIGNIIDILYLIGFAAFAAAAVFIREK